MKRKPSITRVARLYASKKKVIKTKDGEEVEIYEYSKSEIKKRNEEKSKKVEKVRKSLEDLEKQIKKDMKDPEKKELALAVALINQTYERVGNDDSADNGHFGVTGWQKEHISFKDGKAILEYVGKSGVKQKKEIVDKQLVNQLQKLCKDKSKQDCILGDVDASDVNAYLKDFGITAKDIRGFHANNEMLQNLAKIRSRNGELPSDKKEKTKLLKEEFKEALEEAAQTVGHEPSTLRGQYLVPHLEDEYMKDGTIITRLKKAKYKMPRKWDKEHCESKTCDEMGFSERASCAPYKSCPSPKKKANPFGGSMQGYPNPLFYKRRKKEHCLEGYRRNYDVPEGRPGSCRKIKASPKRVVLSYLIAKTKRGQP